MPHVYIINDMNHSFDKAAKYGDLVYVTEGNVPIFKTDVSLNMLRKGLGGFNAGQDYLLISGPAILCMMAALDIARNNHDHIDHIQTLIFDAKAQDYVVRHIPV